MQVVKLFLLLFNYNHILQFQLLTNYSNHLNNNNLNFKLFSKILNQLSLNPDKKVRIHMPQAI